MNDIEPAALVLMLLATVYGAMAHLFWGRRWRHVPLFWGSAFVGCLLIYGLSLRINQGWPAPAGVPLIETSAAAWIALIIASRFRV